MIPETFIMRACRHLDATDFSIETVYFVFKTVNFSLEFVKRFRVTLGSGDLL